MTRTDFDPQKPVKLVTSSPQIFDSPAALRSCTPGAALAAGPRVPHPGAGPLLGRYVPQRLSEQDMKETQTAVSGKWGASFADRAAVSAKGNPRQDHGQVEGSHLGHTKQTHTHTLTHSEVE